MAQHCRNAVNSLKDKGLASVCCAVAPVGATNAARRHRNRTSRGIRSHLSLHRSFAPGSTVLQNGATAQHFVLNPCGKWFLMRCASVAPAQTGATRRRVRRVPRPDHPARGPTPTPAPGLAPFGSRGDGLGRNPMSALGATSIRPLGGRRCLASPIIAPRTGPGLAPFRPSGGVLGRNLLPALGARSTRPLGGRSPRPVNHDAAHGPGPGALQALWRCSWP
jgi:hypothetical protein